MQTVKEKIMTTVSDLIEGPDKNQTCYEILDFVDTPNSGRLHIVTKKTGVAVFAADYSITRLSFMLWNVADESDSAEFIFAKDDITAVRDWFIGNIKAPDWAAERDAKPTRPTIFKTPGEAGIAAAGNDKVVTVHELPGGENYGICLNDVTIAEFMPGNRQEEFVRTFLESNNLYPDSQSQESFPWLAD